MLTPENIEFLKGFEEKLGRPPRILHIGNIANNAYINAKLLNEAGLDCDVICYNYYHCMGCPEWEDADYEGEIQNQNYPDWRKLDLKGFRRPRWFVQGPLQFCLSYLIAKRQGDLKKADKIWKLLGRYNKSESHILPQNSLSMVLLNIFLRCLDFISRACLKFKRHMVPAALHPLIKIILIIPRLMLSLIKRPKDYGSIENRLIMFYNEVFPDRLDKLTRFDFYGHYQFIPLWKRAFKHYDLVQAYATDPIIPLICDKPYAAYEHGTIRNIPFEATPEGRLCALSYRMAGKVFVTNSDNLEAAGKLKLDNVVNLPHAFDERKVEQFKIEHRNAEVKYMNTAENDVIFIAPARHHWHKGSLSWRKGNDLIIKAVSLLRQQMIFNFRVVFIEWGLEVDLSRQLIDESGCGENIIWLKPMKKKELWKHYLTANAVIDQFSVPALGGVGFESLAFSKRLITNIDSRMCADFFGSCPPLLNCADEFEIYGAMRLVIDDPLDAAGRGEEAKAFIHEHHSAKVVVNKQLTAYRDLL